MKRNVFLVIFAVLVSFGASCGPSSGLDANNSQVKEPAKSNEQPRNENDKPQSPAEKEKKSTESKQEDVAKASAELEKKVQANASVVEIVKRNKAVVQWEKELGQSEGMYTMNLQGVLVRDDRRPILFFGFLHDIAKEDGKVLVEFDVVAQAFPYRGRFIIECKSDQIKQIASQSASFYAEYAVVALMSSVSRPKYKIKAKPLSETEAEIELDEPDIFLASGRCLGLVLVESRDK